MFTALAPPPTAGQGRKPLPSLLGDPVLPGQSPSRRSAENFTKAQLLPRNRPAGFSPVPAGSGCCRGRRALREDGEAERKQRGRGGAGERAWGLAMGRPGPSRGCFGKFKSRSAPQHRHAPEQAQASREGRRALSPALKSHRRPSLFPSILLVAVSFPSPPSTPARKHTTSLLLPRGKSSTTTSVYLWKKE